MDFYYMDLSAPCRAVRLTLSALGLSPNMKILDVMVGDQNKPEFLAINPQHCIPTLVDEKITIWESRAICTYLASKYGKDDSLYPSNPDKRVEVDKMLYFDIGTLYQRFADYAYPAMFEEGKLEPANLVKLQEALGMFNTFLEGRQYAAGDSITVADHSLIATVSTMEDCGIKLNSFPNVCAWASRCKANMPNYKQANDVGSKEFSVYAKGTLLPAS